MLQHLIFVALAPIALTSTVVIGMYAWRRRRSLTAALQLAWCAFVVSCWLIYSTLELVYPTEADTLAFAKITYAFIGLAPVTWLAVALAYTGRQQWLTLSRIWPLLIVPAVSIVLVLTNDAHHLIWRSYTFRPAADMLAMQVTTRGPWFWVQTTYLYALVIIGALVIGSTYRGSLAPYRQQTRWAILGAALPLIANTVYVSHIFPEPRIDFSPLIWSLGSTAFAVAIFRYQLFKLMPIARQAVMDAMCEGMIIVDEAGDIADMNPAAQFVIGSPAIDVLGRSLEQAWPRWRTLAGSDGAAAGSPGEVWVERGATKYCFDVRVSTLADRRSRRTGQLIMLRDITEHKETEEELRRYNLELQARNAELDAFAHTAAHDLKRPLSVILGFNQLAERRLAATPDPDPFMEECVRTIERTGGKMADIVNELLMLASVRQAEVVPEQIDTGALVAAAMENLKTMAFERHAQIDQPEAWPCAMGHAQWIEQVWTNLLSNALKYGGDPPRIDLGAKQFTDPETGRAMVRYWVSDNGPGLTPEERSRLFTAFARMHPDQAEGHGLGLFLVRRIVEKVGGQVGVETAVGEGSLFYFNLPAADNSHG